MIVPATPEHILEVCLSLRDDDHKEVMLTRWTESVYDLAKDLSNARGGKFAAVYEGRAVAVFGVVPVTPGMGQAWLVGTDEIGKCGVRIAHASKMIIRTLFDTGVHRIQAHSASFHTQAHKWLESIGCVRESTAKSMGKDGTDFYCYVVTK